MHLSQQKKSAEAGEAETHLLTYKELKKLERANLVSVLNRTRWKISGPDGAAEFLGVRPATLTSRLKIMGIERPRLSER